jgi:hypothetical protein
MFANRSEENVPQVNHSDQAKERRLGRVAHILAARATSVRQSELDAVKYLERSLCPSAITELALRSTNPAVSNLALQSVAGLHHDDSPFKSEDLPTDLRLHLRSAFESHFHSVGDGIFWNFLGGRISLVGAPTTAVERLARGVASLPDFSQSDSQKMHALARSTSVGNISVAALLGCPTGAGRQGFDVDLPRDWSGWLAHDLTITRIWDDVLHSNPISLTKVHPWTYQHLRLPFIKAIQLKECAALSSIKSDHILRELVKTLSSEHVPSLQDELRFLCLYVKSTRPQDLNEAALSKLLFFGNITDRDNPLAINPSVG